MEKKTKAWLIVAAALILIGVILFGGVMTVLGWDFTKLTTFSYGTNSYTINDEYKNMTIITKTANVEFVPSGDSSTSVICYEQEKAMHSVKVKDDTLVIELNDTRKWYEHIGISFTSPKITVYIPEKEFGDISVKATTGNICIENTEVRSLDLSVTTGNIRLSGIRCSGDMRADITTGDTYVRNTLCHHFSAHGTTGDVELYNVIAEGNFDIKRLTGDIEFEGCDAAELYIKTTTGDIEGTLLTDKVFIANTVTGDVEVPKNTSGGRCELYTTTGDIEIDTEH